MRDLLPPGQRRDSPCRGGTVPPPHCVGASTPLFFSPRRKEKRRGRWKRKGRFFLTNRGRLDHSTGFSAALRRLCYPDVLFPRLPLRCVGTSSISLASAWRQKLAHFAVPPFPTKSLILWGPHKFLGGCWEPVPHRTRRHRRKAARLGGPQGLTKLAGQRQRSPAQRQFDDLRRR